MRIVHQEYRDGSSLATCAAETAPVSVFFRTPHGRSQVSEGEVSGSLADGTAITNGSLQSRTGSDASRRWIATATSWLMACVIEGFAAHADALYHGFTDPGQEREREREREYNSAPHQYNRNEHGSEWLRVHGSDLWARVDSTRSAGVQTDPPVSPTSPVARFWSRMRGEWNVRFTVAKLGELDDQTLKDIGIHRCQIESVARHGDPYSG